MSQFHNSHDNESQDPLAQWDKATPVYMEGTSRFFFDEESLRDHLEFYALAPSDVRLVLCSPNYAQKLDTDYFENEISETDDDVPAELVAAVDAFNAAIAAYGKPLSWSPTRERVTITDNPEF